MTRFILGLLGLMVIAMPVTAEETAPLDVGGTIPKEFKAVDALGRDTGFDSLKGEKGLILIFTRSADWCQYCKTQLRDWNESATASAEFGYKVAAISYDTPKQLKKFSDDNKLNYTVLSDTDSAMINSFGIRNTKFAEGSRFYGIPNPAIYIFDADGKVTHVFREDSYKDRPAVADVLGAVGWKAEDAEG